MNLLSGNEALAKGAWLAGVHAAVGYPGTPSTEILENLALYPEVKVHWSANEKTALETAIGVSIGGGRVLVTMKHVGLNVAADPLMTFAEAGVTGGLVIVTADDPGMHSSQNEQDNRVYAKFAQIPMFEPSDSRETLSMVCQAFAISEEYDTPVFLRLTTRIAHGKTAVEWGERIPVAKKPYKKQPEKFLMIPGHARHRHQVVLDRTEYLRQWAETSAWNVCEWHGRSRGVITHGAAYQYVKETASNVSVLKLGMAYPLPPVKIRDFAESVDELWVIEEGEPFIEEHLRQWGLAVHGKEYTGSVGELSAASLRERLPWLDALPQNIPEIVPDRPPVMCPGCPHRGVFHVLGRLRRTVMGDIGCYTLGMMPPLNAMDTSICMGASIPMALGMEMAGEDPQNIVAVLGDSTFFHSGMTGLLDLVYNQGLSKVLILDNGITAMTGHQGNPGNGTNLQDDRSPQASIEMITTAIGMKTIVVDPLDISSLKDLLQATGEGAYQVIVARRPCALIIPPQQGYQVDPNACRSCKVCIRTGCPALQFNGISSIVSHLCVGCGLCAAVCPFDAIHRVGDQA